MHAHRHTNTQRHTLRHKNTESHTKTQTHTTRSYLSFLNELPDADGWSSVVVYLVGDAGRRLCNISDGADKRHLQQPTTRLSQEQF